MDLKNGTMNLQEGAILRKLDEVVRAGGIGVIGTNYGDVSVHTTRLGFCGEVVDFNNRKIYAFGPTPADAFYRAAEKVKALNSIDN